MGASGKQPTEGIWKIARDVVGFLSGVANLANIGTAKKGGGTGAKSGVTAPSGAKSAPDKVGKL